ncbi:hypothetical protein AWB81_02631 [Caballeronia arationis]|jgi:hypothetical protein|uniref:Uncharacterized protein n=1 Tax=Caballeronia arationis TaxID=1777142 RepID=A0A7Z7N6Q6_9BURK|nr:hypothetical protein [Caballeronia arationis]SAK65887.1 hypothetical protein AWB81_02631 [Caballeronia arationis]SOE89142.1 hypothetical protein SAMN05446927_7808 [Caballeronia arationis]
MNTHTSSLHRLVDKWLGPTQATPARVIRVTRKGAHSTRCVRVEVERHSGLLAVLFFRHEDGTWCVFPPTSNRPSMNAFRFAA